MHYVPVRGTGLYKEAMWRTHDVLKRLGYPVYSFETHCPTYLRKRWVFEAYCDFQDFVTDDRFHGMIGPSARRSKGSGLNGTAGRVFLVVGAQRGDARARACATFG